MRGSPLFQTILIAFVFLLTAVPVWRLTRQANAVPLPVAVETPSTATKPTSLEVEVFFAPAPTDFQIKNLDRTVLEGHGPSTHFTGRWDAAVPPEGVDLIVQARWPGPAADPVAARVTVRFPDGRLAQKSFWGSNAALADVFTVVPGATP